MMIISEGKVSKRGTLQRYVYPYITLGAAVSLSLWQLNSCFIRSDILSNLWYRVCCRDFHSVVFSSLLTFSYIHNTRRFQLQPKRTNAFLVL